MEQARTGDGRHQGPRAGERGEGPEGGGLEDVFFCRNVLSSRVAWLHGCTERSRCCSLEPGKAEKIFLFGAGGQPAQGVVVASCRTKAGAGLPWPMGDAARPERRDGGPGLHGTRGRSREREKFDVGRCMVLNGDTEGSSRSCPSSSRGYLIRESANGSHSGVYGLGGPDCIPKSAALQQVEQQWLTSSVCSLTDMMVARLDV